MRNFRFHGNSRSNSIFSSTYSFDQHTQTNKQFETPGKILKLIGNWILEFPNARERKYKTIYTCASTRTENKGPLKATAGITTTL